jgi:hypothetical protein
MNGRLRLFENSVLRRIFGPSGEEATGGLKKMHDEELKVQENVMSGACSTHGRDGRHVCIMYSSRNLKERDQLETQVGT